KCCVSALTTTAVTAGLTSAAIHKGSIALDDRRSPVASRRRRASSPGTRPVPPQAHEPGLGVRARPEPKPPTDGQPPAFLRGRKSL
ncbi:MAG: hypothetical protein KC766_33315, partial [Myxococcales bacterium]|nr:hypothetical protein [Myxococcales bacterium]